MQQALSELQAVGRALDHIDVGTCVFDDAGRLPVWNEAFLQLFPGHAEGLAAGETFAGILQRFHGERIADADLLALEQYVRDGMAGRDDGGPFSFSLEGRQIEVASIDVGGAGRVSVWRCPPQAEEPADGMLANYRLLAEFSSDVIVLVGDGRIEQVSPSVERLLGRAPASLVGTPCRDLLAPEHATMLDAALQLEMRQAFQARARHADGGTRWVEITLAHSPHLPGSVVLTLRDIGARKDAELQLQQASRELEALAHTDALTGAANRRSFDIGRTPNGGARSATPGRWRCCCSTRTTSSD
ncbi:PAS domain-containing protein [Ramlibacter terrae]|uniref:PAS domain-containing protein n=1 Tax=Ramlibacter terrae TaxID=2732511 RepID=A0ABX6P7I8_9BURK|nr:PAS domain-containing protein [Ramlibacter terrae]